MTKVKRFSLILLSTLIFVCAAFVFAGCGDKNKNCKIYVFSTVGGHVKVDDNEQIVKFGDEGSKIFTYKQKDKITLKAVADKGYDFVKWQFSDGYDGKYADKINQTQLEIVVDVDELVIKAVFDLNGSVELYNVNYPTDTTGYTIAPISGYTSTVLDGGNFKFKVTLDEDYSNSSIVVKANDEVLTADNEGVYTILNINEDISITVEGVTLNPDDEIEKYEIFTNDTRFTIVPISQEDLLVEEGKSFVFRIQLTDGYKVDSMLVVKGNNNLLLVKEGKYTIDSVNERIEITAEGIVEDNEEPEVVYETYELALDFDEGVKDVYDLIGIIPSKIKIMVAESDKQSQYVSSQFIVKDEDENEISIKEIIDSVEEIAPQVTQFTIGGMAFIMVSGDNITVNWGVLGIVDLTESLIIEVVIN